MRKIAFLIAIWSLGTSVFAQDDGFDFGGSGAHEFSVGAGFGHGALIYGNRPFSFTFGGGLNFGYAYNFTPNFAIVTGLDVNFYSAQSVSSDFFDTIFITKQLYETPWGSNDFDYYVRAQGLREEQTVAYLYVPIMMRYKFPVGNDGFYFMGGAKIGIPIVASYSGSIDQITTTGFSHITQQIYENMPEYKFGTYPGERLDGNLELNLSVVASFEFGYEQLLRSGKSLSFGAYVNYGLTNILNSPNTPPITYSPENINPPHPALPELNSFSGQFDSMKTLGFGLMLRFRF